MRGVAAGMLGLVAGIGLSSLAMVTLGTGRLFFRQEMSIKGYTEDPGKDRSADRHRRFTDEEWGRIYKPTTMHRVQTEIPGPIKMTVVVDTAKGIGTSTSTQMQPPGLSPLGQPVDVSMCTDDATMIAQLEPLLAKLIDLEWKDTENRTDALRNFTLDCKIGIETWLKASSIWRPIIAKAMIHQRIQDPTTLPNAPVIIDDTSLIIPISPHDPLKAWPSFESLRTLAAWPKEIIYITSLGQNMNDLYPLAAMFRVIQCYFIRIIPPQVRVRYVVTESLGGPMAARWLGGLISHTPIVMTFDADDYLAPGSVYQRHLMFKKIPDLDYLLGHYEWVKLAPDRMTVRNIFDQENVPIDTKNRTDSIRTHWKASTLR